MILASVSENQKIEKRIAITPEIAKKYISLGFKILLSENYGKHLGIEDKDYIVPWAYARYAYVDKNIQGKDCCGYCVSVYWPSESKFFTGNVESYDESTGKHKIVYEDGDEEIVDLSKVIFHYWRRSPDFNWIAQQSGKKKKKKKADVVVKEKVDVVVAKKDETQDKEGEFKEYVEACITTTHGLKHRNIRTKCILKALDA